MADRRRESRLREHARGVGFVLLAGAAVLVTGLLVIALFVWAMT
jgi:hypothetical protein